MTQPTIDQLRKRVQGLEEQRLGNSLVRLGRLTYERTVERLRAKGLTDLRLGFTTPLPHLDRTHGTRVTVLAERMGVTKQAAGQMVTQLERAGLVSRRSDPDDGRARLVELTHDGFEVLLAGLEVFAELESELAEELGASALEEFRRSAELSRRYLERLGADD